jgi:GntR family transcriptional regulator
MTIRVDPTRDCPPSRQIVEAVLDEIARGDLATGDRLPSVRGLAADALVNPNTVGKAYRELEVMGVVAGRNGAGVFITQKGPTLARKARRAATLAAVELAVAAALGAGHTAAVVRRHVEARLDSAQGKDVTERRRAS